MKFFYLRSFGIFSVASFFMVAGLSFVLPSKKAVSQIEKEQYGSTLSSSRWNSTSIPVCWENEGAETEKAWVRDAVTRELQEKTVLTFTGWNTCNNQTSQGIRIGILDENPHTKGLGSALDNMPNGMVLNFTFENFSKSYCQSANRQYCIEAIAVHEFGHAIGMAHEQNRSDTFGSNINNTCIDAAQGTTGDTNWGPWDSRSIMNYCNPAWNNAGVLSAMDVETINSFYGANSRIRDWGYSDLPRFMADVNADNRVDYCRFVGNSPNVYLSCKFGASNGFLGTSEYDFDSFTRGFDRGYDQLPQYMADVNGDSRADYCRFVGDSPNIFLSCNLADKDGFGRNQYQFSSVKGIDVGYAHLPRYLADVNGDSRADYCRFVGDSPNIFLSCNLSEGDGFGRNQYQFKSVKGIDVGHAHLPRTLIDINYDDRADYCRYVGDSPNIFLSCNLAKGNGFGNNQYEYRADADPKAFYNLQ